jgi:predicted nucleic acid-binding protein
MKGLFVDTAGWVACADAADPAHRQAAAARDHWLEQGGLLVTTDYVADETLTITLMW